MKNEKVSLKLNEMSVNDKTDFAGEIVNSMNGNSNFTNAGSLLNAVSTAANALHVINLQVLAGDMGKMDLRNAAEDKLDNLLNQLANYVENAANAAALNGADAKAIISSAGMAYKKEKSPGGLPEAPLHINAQTTGSEGEIELSWDAMPRAYVYVIEYSTDPSIVGTPGQSTASGSLNPDALWVQSKIVTRHRYTLDGLAGGARYAFRVFCVGSHGYGPYSPVVVAKVL